MPFTVAEREQQAQGLEERIRRLNFLRKTTQDTRELDREIRSTTLRLELIRNTITLTNK